MDALFQHEKLSEYLEENIEEALGFFTKDYPVLQKSKWNFDDFVVAKSGLVSKLDYSAINNVAFYFACLNYAERFKLQGSYSVLTKIADENGIELGHRHHAAQIFILNIKKRNDHIDYFDEIVEKLQYARDREEDNDINVLVTFANYYANAVGSLADVAPELLSQIVGKVDQSREKFRFLNDQFVEDVLSLDVSDYEEVEHGIQLAIQSLYQIKLERSLLVGDTPVESGTSYADELSLIEADFAQVRYISMDFYNSLSAAEKDVIYTKLARGVKIIDEDELLYGYITLFGSKHQIKLEQCFNALPTLPDLLDVVDWGCGQGLATMVFTDYLNRIAPASVIGKIILNEPSPLAIARAALHVRHFNDTAQITTVTKPLDDIKSNDLKVDATTANIHLFSNILDIEYFDMYGLINLITDTFSGRNYFVCASPYVSDMTRNRLDIFANHFRINFAPSFHELLNVNVRHQAVTKVLRVFSVDV